MEIRQKLRSIRFSEWRFLQLTAFLFILIFLSPLFTDRWLLKTVSNFVFLNSILVLFSTEGKERFFRRVLITLWIISLVFSFISLSYSENRDFLLFDTIEIAATSLQILILIFGIMIYVFKSEKITIDGIFASLTVYLMIGYLFALVYLVIELNFPGSFHFPDIQHDLPDSYIIKNNLFYFSIVTLATLGYGDIVPETPLCRAISMMEAVTGQFFVSVVIALIIGKLVLGIQKKNS